MKLNITNRSAWPTPALRLITEFALRRMEFKGREYSLLAKACNRESWGGRGGVAYQRIWMARRFARLAKYWPMNIKDSRYKWAEVHIVRSRFELLVYLIAHEAAHAFGGPGDCRAKRDPAGMEFRCNRFAMETVEALRERWPRFRAELFKRMRADRTSRAAAKAAKAALRGPEAKAEKARDKLAEWQKRAKLASTKIRKYRAALRRYERLAAAKAGI